MKIWFLSTIIISVMACKSNNQESGPDTIPNRPYEIDEHVGYFLQYEESLSKIVDVKSKAKVLAKGFSWSEGCLWVADQNMLLFSDVPHNRIHKWTEIGGTEVYLSPSGYTGEMPSESREPGSNGLALHPDGKLLICQHGNRAIAKMKLEVQSGSPLFEYLATQYQGKKFNSPNDLYCTKEGEIYFTDPPYGLPTQDDKDPKKEIPWNGVYKINNKGEVVLLCDSITRPNGIAMFPGEKRLLVACSDSNKPNWYVWDVEGDTLKNGQIFYSLEGYDKSLTGLPDGCKIDSKGNVYATGPGGVYFFDQNGKILGLFKLRDPASNCALSNDEKVLFITNDKYVLKLSLL